jgi:squalene-hopene/tetraprenyl-beta-curcumene cyclase
MIDPERLQRAYLKAREALLAERVPEGHWVGELSSSALSTATACSALSIARRHADGATARRFTALIDAGLAWITARQNADGGWGDTDKSFSNISTTMLVRAAIHLACATDQYAGELAKADGYISAMGGIDGLRRRYGKDKTFAVPILTNCALAGLVDWSEVSPLPFEAACLPQSWYRFMRLPVVSYAIPALVAIGQARYFHKKPWNPIARVVRALAVERSLKVLRAMQPSGGGYLEAAPLTSFVAMSLASIGRHDHIVCREAIRFLVENVRADGSWPIDTNLATWVTTLAINALGEYEPARMDRAEYLSYELIDWVAKCQHSEKHPFTAAEPGGWGWSDLSGALPDADDTPGALLALKRQEPDLDKVTGSPFWKAIRGIDWLFNLQNSDGGWPTFCRGWGLLPFDRSGTDLTAHALRAIHAWGAGGEKLAGGRAISRGFSYLAKHQRPDGSWLPLWFGNQHRPDDENPLYGTSRVLLAYRDLKRMNSAEARRGVAYLLSQQNGDGGWGGSGKPEGGKLETRSQKLEKTGVAPGSANHERRTTNDEPIQSSVEETALVVEALLGAVPTSAEELSPDLHPDDLQPAIDRGVQWLIMGVESGRFREASPIGFYFAKLWYYEKLYPLIFTVSALRHAVETPRSLPPN